MNLFPNIDDIYDKFLRSLEQSKTKHFRVSSAGYCYKKQIFSTTDIEGMPIDQKTMRLFRLGTLIHEDIQKALKAEYKDAVWIEGTVEFDKWNVKGHYDALIKQDGFYLMDIKTIASYKWRKQFGRESNRDKNPAVNYELQVGTYGLGLEDKNPVMLFYWYNKDNSLTKTTIIEESWKEKAAEYWDDFTECRNEINLLQVHQNGMPCVPMYEWECRYCQYSLICIGGPQ